MMMPSELPLAENGIDRVSSFGHRHGRRTASGHASSLQVRFGRVIKRLIKRSLYRVGVEVTRAGPRPTPRLVDFIESRRIDTVIDVGANIGQFGAMLRRQGYRGRIVSFEPLSEAFAELRRRADDDGNWDVHNFALGADDSVAILCVSENTVFSSFLDQTAAAQEFDPTARFVRRQTTDVRRLDDIFHVLRPGRAFLKIDTQGFERRVLDGAAKSLEQVLGVQAELPLRHLYRDVWSFAEALAYMERRGFIPCQLRPTNYDSCDWVSMLELDCIFRRTGPDERAAASSGQHGGLA